MATLATAAPSPAEGRVPASTVSPPPRGTVSVRVIDHDTGKLLPARVLVTRVAGPSRHERVVVSDTMGETSLLLPVGTHAITVTRGPEYSIDRQLVTVTAERDQTVALALRRVIDTPGWAACDLHVHASASFDSRVTPAARVRSLLAAGVDFAVPSEHGQVGTYKDVGEASALAWVPGVEVTTPRSGHFNVFPFVGTRAPRAEGVGLPEILAEVRGTSPNSLVQVNHPRLGDGMGYFHALRLDVAKRRGLASLPMGFDTIEVYSGKELSRQADVEAVLREWLALFDAGREHWATGGSDGHHADGPPPGYPRTYVALAGDDDGASGAPVDGTAVIASLKRGHATVTSGPFVELRQGQSGPGDELVVEDRRAKVEVVVRAAPWIDVSSVELVAGGQVLVSREVPHRRLELGPPTGSLEEARAGAVRFRSVVEVQLPPGARGLVAIARGTERTGSALPGVDFRPMGFSNPMVIR